jgi:hypothetical protein
MNRPESEFYNSSFNKVIKMIEIYNDLQNIEAAAMQNNPYESKYFNQNSNVEYVKSLKEIEGWSNGI